MVTREQLKPMENIKQYIEVNAIKDRFKRRTEWLEKDVHDQYSLGLFHGAEYDAKLIDELPIVEVSYGQWITAENGITYCGKCKHIDDYASVHYYCPFCGTKMDLEEKA